MGLLNKWLEHAPEDLVKKAVQENPELKARVTEGMPMDNCDLFTIEVERDSILKSDMSDFVSQLSKDRQNDLRKKFKSFMTEGQAKSTRGDTVYRRGSRGTVLSAASATSVLSGDGATKRDPQWDKTLVATSPKPSSSVPLLSTEPAKGSAASKVLSNDLGTLRTIVDSLLQPIKEAGPLATTQATWASAGQGLERPATVPMAPSMVSGVA